MESTFYIAVTLAALSAWHLRNRRHPGWKLSNEGRSYLLCGYSVVVTLVFWLTAASATPWEWGLAAVWGLGGFVAFVLGFDALNRAASGAAAPSPTPSVVDFGREVDAA